MTVTITLCLSLILIVALCVIVKVVRDIGRELDAMSDQDKKTVKKIEKWRDGK